MSFNYLFLTAWERSGKSLKLSVLIISIFKVSKLLPEKFAEQIIRVYCKKTDTKIIEAATKYFVQWCMDKDFSKPMDGDVVAPELTPMKKGWNKDDENQDSNRNSSGLNCKVKLF
uniref:Uncharacterized protein n=1 Tax=Micrurus spixii TaxID=129469 RepID=A0A2D4MR23_9SAUR